MDNEYAGWAIDDLSVMAESGNGATGGEVMGSVSNAPASSGSGSSGNCGGSVVSGSSASVVLPVFFFGMILLVISIGTRRPGTVEDSI